MKWKIVFIAFLVSSRNFCFTFVLTETCDSDACVWFPSYLYVDIRKRMKAERDELPCHKWFRRNSLKQIAVDWTTTTCCSDVHDDDMRLSGIHWVRIECSWWGQVYILCNWWMAIKHTMSHKSHYNALRLSKTNSSVSHEWCCLYVPTSHV